MTPNSCEDFRAFIDPYLDDEFDTRERAMFDAHLASCSNCRDFFEQKQWLHNAVRPRLKDSCILPAEARQRIQSQLKSVQRPRKVREAARRLAKPIPAVALAAAAALFIIPLTGFKSTS